MGDIIVGFPRSGLHLTAKLLGQARLAAGLPYSFCDFYSRHNCGCRSIPCKTGRLFQKNHDFSLDLKVAPKSKYLVLFRTDPVTQLEAYFRFTRKANRVTPTMLPDFAQFYQKNIGYYTAFVRKWGRISQSKANVKLIMFDDLISDTSGTIREILRFFEVPIPADMDTMIMRTGVVRRSFGPDYFEFLRRNLQLYVESGRRSQ